jgi:hypothetical protein
MASSYASNNPPLYRSETPRIRESKLHSIWGWHAQDRTNPATRKITFFGPGAVGMRPNFFSTSSNPIPITNALWWLCIKKVDEVHSQGPRYFSYLADAESIFHSRLALTGCDRIHTTKNAAKTGRNGFTTDSSCVGPQNAINYWSRSYRDSTGNVRRD